MRDIAKKNGLFFSTGKEYLVLVHIIIFCIAKQAVSRNILHLTSKKFVLIRIFFP